MKIRIELQLTKSFVFKVIEDLMNTECEVSKSSVIRRCKYFICKDGEQVIRNQFFVDQFNWTKTVKQKTVKEEFKKHFPKLQN
jgi:hypothetical protein